MEREEGGSGVPCSGRIDVIQHLERLKKKKEQIRKKEKDTCYKKGSWNCNTGRLMGLASLNSKRGGSGKRAFACTGDHDEGKFLEVKRLTEHS